MGNMPQLMQMRAAQNQNALAQYQLSSAKREDASTNALNTAYQNAYDPVTGKIDSARLLQSLASSGAGSKIPGVQKSLTDAEIAQLQRLKLQGEVNALPGAAAYKAAQTTKVTAEATELANKTKRDELKRAISDISKFDNAADALQNLAIHERDGKISPEKAAQMRAVLSDPNLSFSKWQRSTVIGLMDEKDRVEATRPKPVATQLGNRVVYQDMNPDSPTFKQEILPEQKMGAPPSTDAASEQARAATSNAATAAAREARLAKGPIGTSLTPEQNDALFGENGAVAAGLLNPNKINSRNASMWADAFLRNPNADPVKIARDVETTTKAVKDFGTGPQGVKITAFNTAIDHLDTLYQLGEALKNKDMMALNAAANFFGVQTGQPATTMYNQAARIVGAEISKAIVPGVGTGREREETAKAFNAASSPDQLAGADVVAKQLLGGQLASLEQQYKRTTKREDFAEQLLSPAGRKAYQSSRSAMKPTDATPAVAAPAEAASAAKPSLGEIFR
jgi:hypothetical protein